MHSQALSHQSEPIPDRPKQSVMEEKWTLNKAKSQLVPADKRRVIELFLANDDVLNVILNRVTNIEEAKERSVAKTILFN